MYVKMLTFGSSEWNDMVALRDEVLRRPLGLQFTAEYLQKEKYDFLFGLYDGESLMACLILSPGEERSIQMRQVAVSFLMQGKGLGKQLVTASERWAINNGYTKMFCHARATAAPFYLLLGYHIVGEPFTEVSIEHFYMEKELVH